MRTVKLWDRTSDEITLDEAQQIAIRVRRDGNSLILEIRESRIIAEGSYSRPPYWQSLTGESGRPVNHTANSAFGRLLGVYSKAVKCEERARLMAVYLAALDQYTAMNLAMPDIRTDAWPEVIKEARVAYESALAKLNNHRKEHGC